MTNMIEVAGVSKAFGSQTVLRDVNFKVEPGEILGSFRTEWCWKNDLYSNIEWSHKT